MKKILVVDDSALMRRLICDIINTDSAFEANDVCRDGLEAYEKLKKTTYDCVILDVNMPRMDGLQLLERLREENIRANVIMVSTLTTRDAEITMRALEMGAIDFVPKPSNVIEAKVGAFRTKLLSVLRAVLREPTVSRAAAREAGASERSTFTVPDELSVKPPRTVDIVRLKPPGAGKKIVALACSTGGPKALQAVIPALKAGLNAPVVLVQHMPQGFTKTMADRLDELSDVRVKEAESGELLQPGWVYVAPGGRHLQVQKNRDGSHGIVFSDIPAIGGLKPCANVMFDSLAGCGYDEVVCVVLTGVGADGTNGILSLAKHRPVHVIAQDEQTSVVYGMPKAIARTGVVDEIMPINEIANSINQYVGVK